MSSRSPSGFDAIEAMLVNHQKIMLWFLRVFAFAYGFVGSILASQEVYEEIATVFGKPVYNLLAGTGKRCQEPIIDAGAVIG